MNARAQRVKQIMSTKGHCSQLDKNTFSVRSQTNPENRYKISKTKNGLICDCPDHTIRKADCKHIKIVLDVMKNNRCWKSNSFRIIERSLIKVCKFCDSGNIVKAGIKKNKNNTMQRFKCQDCKKRFTANFGFENTRYDSRAIAQAIQMYYQRMSVRDIECNFEMMGIDVSYRTVYDWIAKYSKMVSNYLNEIVPRTHDRTMVRADEVWVKVAGEQKYLFASMDDDARY